MLEDVARWQSRPLNGLYAIVFFGALRVKMRDEGTVRDKAVYLAIGVLPDGRKGCARSVDRATMKLQLLQLREMTKEWKMPPREWYAATAQFSLLFGDRFEMNQ